MAETNTDTDHSMTTRQHRDTQARVQKREPENEEAATQANRERWGQDPWVMRWGC
jgi:hypothetical protein